MRFCDSCGSRLRETGEGLQCPKCKTVTRTEPKAEVKAEKTKGPAAIYVVDKTRAEHTKIARTCPKCGNDEAFHWFSTISGEHAGIRRERTMEHFRCAKCLHSWTESS